MKPKKETIIKADVNPPKSKKRGSAQVCYKSDVDDIRAGLKKITSDKELFIQTLIEAGIYDKNLKLTKSYR